MGTQQISGVTVVDVRWKQPEVCSVSPPATSFLGVVRGCHIEERASGWNKLNSLDLMSCKKLFQGDLLTWYFNFTRFLVFASSEV